MQRDESHAPIHTIPLARFIGGRNGPDMASAEFCAGIGKRISEEGLRLVESKALDPGFNRGRERSNVPGFSIAHSGTNWGMA